MESVGGGGTDQSGVDELRASAHGWHSVQLAVLGFIGLCGVLQSSGGSANPRWLQITAGLLVLLALILQCLAIAVVATIAWPLQDRSLAGGHEVAVIRRRLRRGVVITFVAVGVLGLGAISSWWPGSDTDAEQVRVVTGSGVLCGQLGEGRPGAIRLDVDGRDVTVPLRDVSAVHPASSCD